MQLVSKTDLKYENKAVHIWYNLLGGKVNFSLDSIVVNSLSCSISLSFSLSSAIASFLATYPEMQRSDAFSVALSSQHPFTILPRCRYYRKVVF